MKSDDPEIDTAQTPKRLEGRLAPQEKIQETFADSIPNKFILMIEILNIFSFYFQLFPVSYYSKGT